MKVTGVIPSRYGSTRLPGKPLADILGKPMVWWVWHQAAQAKCLDELIVATDDTRIAAAVKKFGGRAVLTAKEHESGTARVAEIARRFDGDIFINIQGDEPLVDPATIKAIVAAAIKDPLPGMVSAKVALVNKQEIADPQVVKVVVDKNDYALYFSRSPIPYNRSGDAKYWKHLGIYGYRRDFLLKIATMPATPLAAAESLEQLKIMENGHPIKVVTVSHDSIGVDTAADLDRVRAILKKR